MNERLRVAMNRAQLSVENLSDIANVDPKTVQRWLAGRVPHARHRWSVANALSQDERLLWPAAGEPAASGSGSTSEILAAYGHRADVPAESWWELFSAAGARIDMLGFAMLFLPEQHPRLCDMLRGRAAEGVRVRVAFGDPESAVVAQRDAEEGLDGALVARIRTAVRYFEPLLGCEGIDLHTQSAPLYHSIFRADDDMFVTPHIYGKPGYNAPLLHLRKLSTGGVFDGFADHFEAIWSASVQLGAPA